MAYVNVLEWRAEQVAEWLQGLDDSIYPYAHSFLNNNVTGRGLLSVTVDDLYKLQVEKVGHQEIILEALEHLRNLHHNLDTENLQYVSLKVACKARSLTNEIRLYGPDPDSDEDQRVDTGTAGAVADVMDALWTLISWLDRPPFHKNPELQGYKESLLKIGVELATNGFRDQRWSANKPINNIRNCCENLAQLADVLIRDVEDPLILQPASLDIATVKRKPNDDTMDFGLGFESRPLNGTHVIRDVRFQSPAHQCARIHPGDEVVQINYQTVVGWTLKKMMGLMEENPSELIVTLKKRPRHLSMFGQIYMKPFRIPARTSKKGGATSTGFNNLPSPRAELLVAPNIRLVKPSKPCEVKASNLESGGGSRTSLAATVGGAGSASLAVDDGDDGSDDDDIIADDPFLGCDDVTVASLSPSAGGNKSPTQSVRSLLSRPRSTPMRRATISGSSPSLSRPYINISEIWSCQARNIHSMDHSSGRACSSSTNSNTSTLQSTDSGHATMASPVSHSDVLRTKSSGAPPRPLTVHDTPLPPTITTTDFSECLQSKLDNNTQLPSRLSPDSSEYVNLEPGSKVQLPPTNAQDSHQAGQKTPMPKPRTQLSSSSSLTAASSNTTSSCEKPSPNRKKPIPQPRVQPPQGKGGKGGGSPHKSNTLKSLTKSLLPDKPAPVQPVPTAEFQSFRRVVAAPPSHNTGHPVPLSPHSHPPSPSGLQLQATTPLKGHPSHSFHPPSPGSEMQAKSKPPPLVPPKLDSPLRDTRPALLPEYVNTTPPAVPARNASALQPTPVTPPSRSSRTSGTSSRSEILQQSKQPSSRRFSGAGLGLSQEAPPSTSAASTQQKSSRPLLGKIPRGSSVEVMSMSSGSSSFEAMTSPTRPPMPPPPAQHTAHGSIPAYCVTDIVDRAARATLTGGTRQGGLPQSQQPPPPPPTLPPVFTPQTYNLQEMHQQRSGGSGIRRQLATTTNPSLSTESVPPEQDSAH